MDIQGNKKKVTFADDDHIKDDDLPDLFCDWTIIDIQKFVYQLTNFSIFTKKEH